MKKAQITVFIMMGLLLVIAVSIYLYLSQRPAVVAPGVLEAPLEIRPVVQFVSDCLAQAGEDQLNRLGARGGYIDPRARGMRINPAEPTESDAVAYTPDADLAIPYWWYLKSPNNCVGVCEFGSLKPPLLREGGQNSIEGQLDDAVAEAMDKCTLNYTSLAIQGYAIRPTSAPKVTTAIGTTGVSFILDYPLIITKGGTEWRYDRFGAHTEVALTELYGMATELTRLEADEKYHYLERDIQQVIDSFTGLQEGGLPPVAYATFELDSGKRWVKEDVHRRVRDLMTAYIPLLQVWGTRNYVFREAPADEESPALWSRLYNLNMLIPLEKNHPAIEVRFSAPQLWREYFNLNCRGQVCAPDSLVNTYGFPFGFQKYNFAYSVSVPVLVELRDPDAFNGKGYTFQYAMEANIRNNEPFPVVDGFSPNTGGESATTSLLCDPDQRTGSTLTINVVDSAGAPVDAAISFTCGDEGCALGSTTGGTLTAQFPRCAGGAVQAVAADRYSQSVALNTHTEGSQTITLISEPIVTLNADFSRVQFLKRGKAWKFNPNPVSKQHGDQIVVMLARNGDANDVPFSSAVELCTDNGGQNSLSEARLVPGNYTVSIITLYHRPITFPPQKRCVASYCYTIPEEPLAFGKDGSQCDAGNPLLIGTSEFNWELTSGMLRDGNTIKFKALVAAIDQVAEQDREIEDIGAVSDMQDASVAYQQYLYPEVVMR